MNIAYLVNHYPKPSHSFIRREIAALEALGHRITRLALRGWDDAAPDPADEAEKARTRYLLRGGVWALVIAVLRSFATQPLRSARALALALRMARRADRSLAYHLAYFGEACAALPLLRAAGVQHLHAHFGTNAAEVALLIDALGGPGYSFTVHGPEEFDKPEALHLADKVACARFVVAVSSYGRSQLYRWVAPADRPKVEVVHCGLDRAFHADAVLAPPVDAPRLVCVGRLSAQKGHASLIEAAARVAARGIRFELVLAGDGELRPEIEAAIALHGLAAAVRITGWIGSAEVRREMLAARAVVLASYAEGLPVVLMEAMALRRPVIATQVAGIPELVLSGEHGWLVAAGDVAALADAMAASLVCPRETLRRYGDAARRRVLQRHDADTEARKLAALIERVAADAATGRAVQLGAATA